MSSQELSGKVLFQNFLGHLRAKDKLETARSYELGVRRFCWFLGFRDKETFAEELVSLRKIQLETKGRKSEMKDKLEEYFGQATSEIGVEAPPRVHVSRNGKRTTSPETKRPFAQNTAALTVTSVREFLKYVGEKREDREYEVSFEFPTIEPKVEKYDFDRTKLQRILAVASLRDQVLVLIGCSSGWGAGDVIRLEKADVQNIIDDPDKQRLRIFQRKKTGARMYLCVSSELERKLRAYIPTVKSKWLFPGYSGQHMTEVQPDAVLKNLCVKAGITSDGTEVIRFHGLRRYFSYTAKNAGMSEPAVEMCMGHRLAYKGAYDKMPKSDVWKQYLIAEQALTVEVNVQTNGLGKTIEAMQKQIDGLTAQLAESTSRTMEELEGFAKVLQENEALRKKVAELEAKKS